MVYAVISEDPILRKETLTKLVDSLVPKESQPFDVRRVTNASNAISQLESYPMVGNLRVVILDEAHSLDPVSSAKISEAVVDIPSSSCLILLGSAKLPAKLQATVSKHGQVYQVGGRSKSDKVDVAAHYIRNMLKDPPPSIVSSIIDRVGTECLRLRGELTKLIDYGELTQEALDAVLVPDPEDVIFQLVDSICARDLARSVKLVRTYLNNDDHGPQAASFRMLAVLRRQLVLIWQTKTLQDHAGFDTAKNTKIPEEYLPLVQGEYNLAEVLDKNSWLGRRYSSQAKALSWDQLVRATSAVERIVEMLKAGNPILDDPSLIVSLGVMEVCKNENN